MLENRGLEIIILAVVLLLLFGAKRLPDSARALGKSLRILKSEVGAMKSEDKPPATADTAPPATVTTVTTTAESPVQQPVAASRTLQGAPEASSTATHLVAEEHPRTASRA
ncbi:Sec-independent protein translocase subunit TatA [Streptacidiphilus sp. PAMC 29251]